MGPIFCIHPSIYPSNYSSIHEFYPFLTWVDFGNHFILLALPYNSPIDPLLHGEESLFTFLLLLSPYMSLLPKILNARSMQCEIGWTNHKQTMAKQKFNLKTKRNKTKRNSTYKENLKCSREKNHTFPGLPFLKIRLRCPVIELYLFLGTPNLEQIPASLNTPQTRSWCKPQSLKSFLTSLTEMPHDVSWCVSSPTATSNKLALFNHICLPSLWQSRGYRDPWGTLV